MKGPLWIALGWTAAVEVTWALILIGIWLFLVDPLWLAQTFLQPDLLKQSDLEGYVNGLQSALNTAGVVILAIGFLCCVTWHVSGAFSRINGPGEAAKLWFRWLVPLIIGIVLSAAAVYYYLQLNNLVREDARLALYPAGIVLFVVSYFIGTLFPTAPKLRPAVPLGPLVPALPGY
jgi:hypothetical protein